MTSRLKAAAVLHDDLQRLLRWKYKKMLKRILLTKKRNVDKH